MDKRATKQKEAVLEEQVKSITVQDIKKLISDTFNNLGESFDKNLKEVVNNINRGIRKQINRTY